MAIEPPPGRPAQYRYRFGTAEFDEMRCELRIEGEPVEIQRRPLDVLAVLLQHAGEVVTREELREAVWHDRVTVDNVIDTALTKLRHALGEHNSGLIRTQPRVGFRLVGAVERVAVGRRFSGELSLQVGQAVPHRENFLLRRRLGSSPRNEVWLARHGKTPELRVYKFSACGAGLAALKREAAVSRLLRETLGEREDFVRVRDWNFEEIPFFLECEYGGENLLEWATEHLDGAPLEQRLELVAQAAEAVAAAHSVGVLHKDLKPANLLITDQPGTIRVRVTDFGSAQILTPDRVAALGITHQDMTLTQARLTELDATTPLYLAPERIAGGTVTVKSDVFALGMVLYQVVVGDLRKPLAPGWERDVPDEIVREDIAAATDGDPAARLGSAAELADRLRRVDARRAERLRQQDLQRQISSDAEALRRARARRPWLIATITTLCVGLIGVLMLYGSVRDARRSLARQYAISRALNTFLTNDFIAVADPDLAGRNDVTVIEATRQAASKIDQVFMQVGSDVRGSLHAAMQNAFFGLSDFPASLAQGREALAAYQDARAPDHLRIAEVRIRLALTLAKISKLKEAAAQLAAARAELEAAHIGDPSVKAQYWWARGSIASYRLALPQALKYYERAWAWVKHAATLPVHERDHIEFSYADTLRLDGDFAAAERQAHDLFVREREQLGLNSPQTCYTAALFASILGFRGHAVEGIPIAKQASTCLSKTLGPTNIRTVAVYQVMGNLQFQNERYADAAVTYAKVAEMSARVTGPNTLRTISARENAAVSRQYAGQSVQAERSLAQTLSVARTALGWTHPTTEDLRYHLADCRLDRQSTGGVERLMDGLSARVLNEGEIESDWTARLAYERGRLALYTGNVKQAILLLRAAEKEIAAKDQAGPISVNAIRKLIRAAQAVKTAPRLRKARAANGCGHARLCSAPGARIVASSSRALTST